MDKYAALRAVAHRFLFLKKVYTYTNTLFYDKVECFVLVPLYLAILYVTNLVNWFATALLLPVLLFVFFGDGFFKRIEAEYRRFMVKKFLVSGRGLSSFKLRVVTKVFRLLLVLTLLTCGLLPLATTSHNLVLTVFAVALPVLTVSTYLYPYVAVYVWASQRKTDAEVEVPYLLVMLRALSSLRIPLHEMLDVIENSVCLRAFSRELKFAKKLAMAYTTSIVTALDIAAANHPSSIVKDYLRRVFSTASELGDIKDIVDRVFETVSYWFELKVAKLFEKFTIIIGSVMFVYFFIPVIVATVLPIYLGGGVMFVLVVVLSVQFAVFFGLYALLSAAYPSSFIIKPPKTLVVIGLASFAFSAVLVTLNALFSIGGHELPWSRNTPWLLAVTTLPPAIIAERYLAKRSFYDKFIYVASDALNLSATTGENPVKVLEDTARRHGRKILSFTRTISASYASRVARRSLVVRMPSLYHASFLEVLMTLLLYGWTSEALKALSSYYEKLSSLTERLKSFAITLELVVVSLAGLVGGFIEFIKNVYQNIESIVKLAPHTGVHVGLVLQIQPGLFNALDSIMLLSILLVSAFVGKSRGGSVFYMYRTALLMLLVYVMSRTLVTYVVA